MGKLEHQPHDLGFHGIDGEALLGLCSPLLRSHNGITVRSDRAIPESLSGILLHGAENMLRVFLRLVLVEQREDLPDHDAHGIIAKVLRDADQFDPVLTQAPHMVFEREMVAGEAAEGVDDDDVERGVPARREFQKTLQFGASCRRCRSDPRRQTR